MTASCKPTKQNLNQEYLRKHLTVDKRGCVGKGKSSQLENRAGQNYHRERERQREIVIGSLEFRDGIKLIRLRY